MSDTFFFYDLETSGTHPSSDRIMQFAGVRTDLNLKLIDDPVNIQVRLTRDVLPSPQAIIISGISPTKNIKEGINEAEFSEIFNREIALSKTIFVGYNNIRFDDEFMRFINYRNFYDAYAWHWQDNSSRWDLLDVVRMTRALRPNGITWPTKDNKPVNKLELLTKANKLAHANAHDALSDTLATIELAKLLKSKQPKLFNYLLSLRKKQELIKLIKDNQNLVYTSSHYSSDHLHTTVIGIIDIDKKLGQVLAYDLREDINKYLGYSAEELAKLWQYDKEATEPRLPVKTIKLNRCPAVAPMSVLDDSSIERLKLNMLDIENNRKILADNKLDFGRKLKEAARLLDKHRDKRRKQINNGYLADEHLYDSFVSRSDSDKFPQARTKAKLAKEYNISFNDERLNQIYLLYRARNYPEQLSSSEQASWDKYLKEKLLTGQPSQLDSFNQEMFNLEKEIKDKNKLKLLKELKSYVSTILNDYEDS